VMGAAATRLAAAVRREPLRHRAAAAWNVLRGNPGYWGGQLAHVGVALCATAIALTGAFGVKQPFTMSPGQQVAAGPFTLTLVGTFERQEPHRAVRGARIELRRGGRLVERLEPRLNAYPRQVQAVGAPAVHEGLDQDVYVSLSELGAGRVSVQVSRFPLMWLLWAGGLLTAAGGAWALTGRAIRRRAARERSPIGNLPPVPEGVGRA
jgi:cytochrome c-type biogenesis protein CcmF